MVVRFLISVATDRGSFHPGQSVEMSAAEAAGFLTAGFAVPAGGDVEEATAPEAAERAVSPKRKR